MTDRPTSRPGFLGLGTPFRLLLGIAAGLLLGSVLALPSPGLAQDALQNVPSTDPQVEEASFHTMEGFEVELFAAEPMVAKPIQMNWDAEGRLWVVSSTTYPQLRPGQEPQDKIYVLEDTTGDGRADVSTVFADSLVTPTGLAPGHGGVYVANSTEMLFLEDTDDDGKADRREIVLSGFGQEDTHHLIHTFRWGPAGRLYFNQGIYTNSHVETPWGMRRLEGGGIWRFQPDSLRLEVFTRGMYNPWGHQFDRWGRSFATDGAGFQGIHFAFPDVAFDAAQGAERTMGGLNPDQPKHASLSVLSGRHLPDSLHGHLLTNDYRANTINRFVVSEDGSGFSSRQAQDLLWTDHVAFRPVDVQVGPDGAIYVADWYSPIIQHGEVDFRDPRRDHKHGRIWRITAEDRPPVEPPDLEGAPVETLLEALKAPEAWTRSHARRLLEERGPEAVLPALEEWTDAIDRSGPEATHHLLEGLWVYQALGRFDTPLLKELLDAEDHRARAAAVRVLYHGFGRIDSAATWARQAARDPHPQVRREAVSALQHGSSVEDARAALSVLERPMDRFLDFALWHTIRELEPHWFPEWQEEADLFGDPAMTVFALMAIDDPATAAHLAAMYEAGAVPEAEASEVLSVIAERGGAEELRMLFDLAIEDVEIGGNGRIEHLRVLESAAQGDSVPDADRTRLFELLDDEEAGVRQAAARLAGRWEVEGARSRLEELVRSSDVGADLRSAALAGIAQLGGIESATFLGETARSEDQSPPLRIEALEELVPLDLDGAAAIGTELLATEAMAEEWQPVYEAFFGQSGGVAALAGALEGTSISSEAAKAGMRVARRRGDRWLKSTDGAQRLEQFLLEAGGELPAPKMDQDLSTYEEDRLLEAVKGSADPVRGQEIYHREALQCTRCHAIAGAGGQVGTPLTSIGASAPTDYLIESLLEPEKAVKDGYSLVRLERQDGSVVSGIIVRETSSEVVLRNAADQEIRVPTGQIASREVQSGSLMPPGLTAQLEREEFVDLVGFLSMLGDDERFTAPETRTYVRRWRLLRDTEEARTLLAGEGRDGPAEAAGAAEPSRAFSWKPAYSRVAGDLPLSEMPTVSTEEGPRSLVRFALEVEDSGDVALTVEDPNGLTLWTGDQEKTVSSVTTLDLEAGRHRLYVLVDRAARTDTSLTVYLAEGKTTADVRIVGGK